YYNGWDRGAEVNRFFIGLAISEDKGLTFRKISNVPVLDRSKEDPYFCASPYVMVENKHWRMWYSSAIAWEKINGRPMPRYYMKYAESNDGITWQRTGDACVDFKSKEEWAIAHPSVTKEGELYKMFYSYSVSDHGYRIGYAESPDGLRWTRMDEEAGIDVSASGWDSEMICYPFVFVRNGVKFMLYNGKRFGKTGFGYAMEQKSNE
ncbi:MAG TPA: hypothetical protein VK503_08735, partial [Candidatus Bathyarchaeia archaeon]|nr:hypothetical protein [Candidatus Bathyarchaeia archaeon]